MAAFCMKGDMSDSGTTVSLALIPVSYSKTVPVRSYILVDSAIFLFLKELRSGIFNVATQKTPAPVAIKKIEIKTSIADLT